MPEAPAAASPLAASPSAADLLQAAREEVDVLLARLNTSTDGLSRLQSRLRLERLGANVITQEKPVPWVLQLLATFANPLVGLLAALALVSLLTGDNPVIAAKTCRDVGMKVEGVLLGA